MKNNKLKLGLIIAVLTGCILFLITICFYHSGRADIDTILSKGEVVINNARIKISNGKLLQEYYRQHDYTPSSSFNSYSESKYSDCLKEVLLYADSLGINYGYDLSDASIYDSLAHPHGAAEDSSKMQLVFNDVLLGMLYHAAYGNQPNFRYVGIKTEVDSTKILQALNEALTTGNWRRAVTSIEPKDTVYGQLKQYLLQYEALAKRDTLDYSSDTMLSRLRAYNLLPDTAISAASKISAIKCFQRLVDADTTGKADAKTFDALMIRTGQRVKEIKESLNLLRWMRRIPDSCVIIVNIPSTRLQILKNASNQIVSMKVIAGKPSWRTPLFASYITGITTYPYWVVPRDIAVKEMLPKIRQSLDYLDENNLQVMDLHDKEMDPESIDWKVLSANNFPYIIRQSTGCDNSLGVMKFDVNSPFSVYLHDTNAKNLFNNRNRLLSHGCIRVGDAFLLAESLCNNGLPKSLMEELSACATNQKPAELRLQKKVPLLIVYLPAQVDDTGKLTFYPDPYHLEKW